MQPRLAAVYDSPPGTCFLCQAAQRTRRDGTGEGERLVDCQFEVPARGWLDEEVAASYATEKVVICESCIVEMAGLVGMLEPRSAQLTEENTSLRAALDQEVQRNADLHAAVEGLRRAGYETPAADEPESEPDDPEPWRPHRFDAAAAIKTDVVVCERCVPPRTFRRAQDLRYHNNAVHPKE